MMEELQNPGTGLPAYSDNAGTAKKCHYKRLSLSDDFKYQHFLDQKTVTVAGVSL